MTTQRHEPELDPIAVELGIQIKTAMFRHKVTGQQIANALGIGRATVSQKLQGKVGITVPELMTIGRVLGTDPANLLPREADLVLLPRLDSNQQPSGYQSPEVTAPVLDLFTGERVA